MSLLKINIASNFVGNVWQTIMGLAFVPLYIKFLGVEAYGLIGIFTTMQAMFAILDMGLGQTMNREMALLSGQHGKEQEMCNLTRSLEFIYWGIAIFIGVIVFSLSSFIANNWVNANLLSPRTIEQAIWIMGFNMTLQWPVSLYSSGLRGLQKLVALNGIIVVFSTLRGAGAVLVLWLFYPTIQAFFLWQIVMSSCHVCLLAIALWFNLPKAENKAKFQKQLLFRVWKFAASISGITIIMAVLAQIDKIILSKLLSLEMFGYYTLASVIAMSLNRFIFPITGGIYPRITQLVSIGDYDGVKQLYHKSCQFVSVMLFPITTFISMFSYEILLLWTQSTVTASKTYILASILVWGTALSGLVNMPYKLQWAYGWTKLGLYISLISVSLFIPFIIAMTINFGAIGSSVSWVILNGISMFFIIQLMHQRLLKTEKWRWYFQDVSLPLLTSLIIAGLGRILFVSPMSQFPAFLILCFIFLVTMTCSAIATPVTRTWLASKYVRYRKGYNHSFKL